MPTTTTPPAAPPTALHVGASVRHPSRGIGKVSTIVFGYLSGQPSKAWVEFDSPHGRRKYVCWCDDLIALPCESTSPRPALRVIDHAGEAVPA